MIIILGVSGLPGAPDDRKTAEVQAEQRVDWLPASQLVGQQCPTGENDAHPFGSEPMLIKLADGA